MRTTCTPTRSTSSTRRRGQRAGVPHPPARTSKRYAVARSGLRRADAEAGRYRAWTQFRRGDPCTRSRRRSRFGSRRLEMNRWGHVCWSRMPIALAVSLSPHRVHTHGSVTTTDALRTARSSACSRAVCVSCHNGRPSFPLSTYEQPGCSAWLCAGGAAATHAALSAVTGYGELRQRQRAHPAGNAVPHLVGGRTRPRNAGSIFLTCPLRSRAAAGAGGGAFGHVAVGRAGPHSAACDAIRAKPGERRRTQNGHRPGLTHRGEVNAIEFLPGRSTGVPRRDVYGAGHRAWLGSWTPWYASRSFLTALPIGCLPAPGRSRGALSAGQRGVADSERSGCSSRANLLPCLRIS